MELTAPEFIDNVHKTLSQSLKEEIKSGSKVSIAAETGHFRENHDLRFVHSYYG